MADMANEMASSARIKGKSSALNPPENLSLELSLAAPILYSANVPVHSTACSSSDDNDLSLELWLWPPSYTQKKTNTTTGSVCTGHSRTSVVSEHDEEIASSRKRQPKAYDDEDEEEISWVRAIAFSEEPKLVMKKKLYATDVSAGHSRLLLADNTEDCVGPTAKKGLRKLLELLDNSEKAEAAGDGGGLPVLLVDSRGREYPAAKLRLWRSSGSYVVLGSWADLVRRNELDPGDVVHVFFFRASGKVGLAVCSSVSLNEESERRCHSPEARKRRREEKGEMMRGHSRRVKCLS